MRKNLDQLGGLVHSQRVLIAAHAERPRARGRLSAGAKERHENLARRRRLFALLNADKQVRKHLSEAELRENFDLAYHFRHVDTLFERVFSTEG